MINFSKTAEKFPMAAPRLLAISVITFCSISSASAASISWSTGPNFGGPNGHLGILTNGSLVEAINLAGSSTASPITVDPAGINITFSTVNSPFFNANWSSATGGGNTDPGWSAILNTFEWQTGANVTATDFLDGLIAGHQYQVQFFAARTDCCGTRTHWFGDGEGNLSTPINGNTYTSILGTFTADDVDQTIQFFDSSTNPILNAYVLRDITPAVPEPTTWAMMLAGLGLLGFSVRRSKAA
ncbi:MAG: PEPxxWA-CTERM sorting domain-containing protein [Nitrosomonas sp.]|jgi:hypothetical protein|uniref:PEPxxWA-CTERM sorting domain-containing protein n=1 Tax=Nitrosomonas sp. TaxID=42353 RepID=UPI002731825D|nr:PEPxxWA-CTERM sorting domain-containing protein [Nitrosomonas sp.]MDP1785717.1 PEPxxWA-CTERM sorting domain-containing protein [Nitrosomonas sp.]MDP2224480.1 PEPxxWA-CTERM sorting domain-containing protein [Nitrosomonas sp.]MDP3663688.1 PEPxxWA-CTERM sorting domain-containing protein [Nitrosomonas sp.]MDZ4105632.1 PEPxxWA-CTERM sorting domain-containing protein [Nitrosomonas sp.]